MAKPSLENRLIRPAFEIILDDDRHIRIFADGRVEGLEGISKRQTIINRIPKLIACAQETGMSEAHG